MDVASRRQFLSEVGQGMLIASVGAPLVADLGLGRSALAEPPGKAQERVTFGHLEPLVDLIQTTPAGKLQEIMVGRLAAGLDLRELVSAAALANARAFGGQDYDGYHTFMALGPSYHMARELAGSDRALPVLKVLYRNANHIQKMGVGSHDTMHHVDPVDGPLPAAGALREAMLKQDMAGAERLFAAEVKASTDAAYNDLLHLVQDNLDVHRVVLAWRSWSMLDLTGREYAHTLLRQSVRYCVDTEKWSNKSAPALTLREVLPKLLDRHKLNSRLPGDREPGEASILELAEIIRGNDRTRAAEAVASALADGVSPEAIGEAISLAANLLVLHDPGRVKDENSAKLKGSVHGASVGVHASDSANAWRNIARVADRRNLYASLIVGAYHTAGQSGPLNPKPYPMAEHLASVAEVAPRDLLANTDEAIRAKDQVRACALVHRMGVEGRPHKPVFDLLLKYAISEDGALHAEKYYRTVTEEFARTRPTLRWRHLAALARVTASEYGYPAPGVAEARKLLQV